MLATYSEFLFSLYLISILILIFRRPSKTTLSYEVNVIPRFNIPAIIVERIIRSDLPVNLQALALRAEWIFKGNQKALVESGLDTNSIALPTSPPTGLDTALSEKDKLTKVELNDNYAPSSFGPALPSSNNLNNNWGVVGQVCGLGRPCMVDEVHLRRFDGLLVIHWL